MTVSPRQHFTFDGRPKRIYLTQDEAEAVRDHDCPAKDVYPCFVGAGPRHWHIGGSRRIAEIRTLLAKGGEKGEHT